MASLNEDQRKAFQDVLNFVNDPVEKFHRISGGAGTGKSFFIAQVADNILKHSKQHNLTQVAVTATTNKAAAVLQQAMPHRAVDIDTIYAFMNLRVKNNFNDGTETIVPTKNWMVHDHTLIIIDEASMANKKLWKYLNDGTTNRCKILFVGDKNQLAPVKEPISPVYTTSMGESQLLTPVRNSNQPALMALCDQLVDTVKTGVFHPIKEVPGVIDFIDGEQMKGVLEREYSVENPYKRVLCYRNQNVIEYNQFIKKLRGFDKPYNIGEVLTNNTSAELTNKLMMYTDQLVKVLDMEEPYDSKVIVPGHNIAMVDMNVQDIEVGTEYAVTCFWNPNDKKEVMKYYSSNKNWEKYFFIKDRFPDLRSVAASTTHKAQGSTYDSVIVDLKDISRSTNKDQTARLLYVALSRPRNHLYIRGKLSERYFE